MSGERERQRSEPSFSEKGIDSIDGVEPDAHVDLDQLLNEINQSKEEVPHKPPVQPDVGEPEEDDLFAADVEHDTMQPVSARPKQSALDFGEIEPSYEGERIEPLPRSRNNNLMGEEPMSRGMMMAGGALVALSLLLGLVGMFAGFSASGKIAALQQSVDALQTKLATMQVSGDPRVGQLQAEQAGITSRLDELTAKTDGLAATSSKGGDSQVAELRKRLDALERKTPQTAKSAANPSKPAAPVKTSAKTPVAAGGEWTVILVSYPASAQAESERTRLHKLGIHAEVLKSQVDGKPWYRLRVPGYATQEAAKAAIHGLEKKSGINGAWVAHS